MLKVRYLRQIKNRRVGSAVHRAVPIRTLDSLPMNRTKPPKVKVKIAVEHLCDVKC
jgi:hypothetical protein